MAADDDELVLVAADAGDGDGIQGLADVGEDDDAAQDLDFAAEPVAGEGGLDGAEGLVMAAGEGAALDFPPGGSGVAEFDGAGEIGIGEAELGLD